MVLLVSFRGRNTPSTRNYPGHGNLYVMAEIIGLPIADIAHRHAQSYPCGEPLIAFRAYSRRDLEAMWDIGNEELAR